MVIKKLPLEYANEIISVVASNRGNRGVSRICRPEYWQTAAEKLGVLSRIAVVSGFFVPAAKAAETDGPGGAAIIARAFMEQGKEAEIWTDLLCVDAIRACASEIGFPPEKVKVPDSCKVLDTYSPDGVIFIERLGRAADGKYYNMHKNDISHWTPSLDTLAFASARRGIVTIGIGDGGNEVGMGNFLSELYELLPEYKTCLSVVRTDIAIPVDVSNWGGYALVAALSYVWGVWRGHRDGDESAMLETLRRYGVVDGINMNAGLSVDGFPLAVQESVVSQLHDIWEKYVC